MDGATNCLLHGTSRKNQYRRRRTHAPSDFARIAACDTIYLEAVDGGPSTSHHDSILRREIESREGYTSRKRHRRRKIRLSAMVHGRPCRDTNFVFQFWSAVVRWNKQVAAVRRGLN